MNHLPPTDMISSIRNPKFAIRNTLLAIAALAAALFSGPQSARAFSFWGPKEGYQIEAVGYSPLVIVDHPLSFSFQYVPDFAYAPHNLAEEYRWNVPVLFYTYDPTFVDYFGSNGVRAVDGAATILNAVPKASEISVDDFPIDEARFNNPATAFHLFDLKSAALEALVTRLGLADPDTWTWAIHDRQTLPGGCPNFQYTIIQRNFAYAVAFHGFKPDSGQQGILIGGGADEGLKCEIKSAIENAIVGSGIEVKIATPQDHYNGDDPRNIVNRLANGNGIQIEQSKAARDGFWQIIAHAVTAVYDCRIV